MGWGGEKSCRCKKKRRKKYFFFPAMTAVLVCFFLPIVCVCVFFFPCVSQLLGRCANKKTGKKKKKRTRIQQILPISLSLSFSDANHEIDVGLHWGDPPTVHLSLYQGTLFGGLYFKPNFFFDDFN